MKNRTHAASNGDPPKIPNINKDEKKSSYARPFVVSLIFTILSVISFWLAIHSILPTEISLYYIMLGAFSFVLAVIAIRIAIQMLVHDTLKKGFKEFVEILNCDKANHDQLKKELLTEINKRLKTNQAKFLKCYPRFLQLIKYLDFKTTVTLITNLTNKLYAISKNFVDLQKEKCSLKTVSDHIEKLKQSDYIDILLKLQSYQTEDELNILSSDTPDEENKAKIQFLYKEINNRINTFDKLRTENYKESMALKLLVILLGSAITIILGFNFDKLTILGFNFGGSKGVALIFSGIMTVLSGWEAFRDPKQLWIRYTVTSSKLRGLKHELNYLSKTVIDDKTKKATIENLHMRYQSILEDANQRWEQFRSEDKSKNITPGSTSSPENKP